MRITVKAKPRSGRDGVERTAEGELTVRVTCPPADGKANERIIELVAKHLGVPKSRVSIVSGLRSKTKILDIS